MKMSDGLAHWTADEVAECLSVGEALCRKLWQIKSEAGNPTPEGDDYENETPDCRLDLDNDDKAGHWWDKLTEEEQQIVNDAYELDYPPIG